MRITVLVSVLALLAVACAVPADSGGDTTTTAAPPATMPTTIELEESVSSTPTVDPNLVPTAVAARVDLASRLDVSENDIEITSLAVGTWNDGSLGCPQEGMTYTQALVEGIRVTLVHDGSEYSYHLGGSGEVFLCVEPAEDAFKASKTGNEALELIPPPGFDE